MANPFEGVEKNLVAAKNVRLIHRQSNGDNLVMSGAVECLARQFPGKYKIHVDTFSNEIFYNNPHISFKKPSDAQEIQMENKLIHRSNQQPVHFLESYVDILRNTLEPDLKLTVNRPYIYLSEDEKTWPSRWGKQGAYILGNFGHKRDYTAKHYGTENYQKLVDLLPEHRFIQVGSGKDIHPVIKGAVNFIGKTSIRDLIRLVYFADMGIGPSTFLQHLFAALEKPYICLLGGREPLSWCQYPTQRILHTTSLPCCSSGACWRNKTVKVDKDESLCAMPVIREGEDPVPKCLDMFRPEDIAQIVNEYYDNGVIKQGAIMQPKLTTDTLYKTKPKIGLVIGTYASLPYIHLHLEARKRYYPEIPCLVADDGSRQEKELALLCNRYGADFRSNTYRLPQKPPGLGDLSHFISGLLWASSKGIDLLVKMSRRWIVLKDWVGDLRLLAMESDANSFSSYCTFWNFGYRTECIGLAVKSYIESTFIEDTQRRIENCDVGLPEAYMHEAAQRLPFSQQFLDWQKSHPMDKDKQGYALWPLLGTSRKQKLDKVLWHERPIEDYMEVANEWHLPYLRKDWILT